MDYLVKSSAMGLAAISVGFTVASYDKGKDTDVFTLYTAIAVFVVSVAFVILTAICQLVGLSATLIRLIAVLLFAVAAIALGLVGSTFAIHTSDIADELEEYQFILRIIASIFLLITALQYAHLCVDNVQAIITKRVDNRTNYRT